MIIQTRGIPDSPVWVVIDKPYERDYEKGWIFSSGLGYIFDSIWRDAGFSCVPFVFCLSPDNTIGLQGPSDDEKWRFFLAEASAAKPVIIIVLGAEALGALVPDTRSYKKPHKVALDNWAGSLLMCPYLSWKHYVIPSFMPDYIMGDWSYRVVQKSIDFGRASEELEYWQTNGAMQPVPQYNLTVAPSYDVLCNTLESYLEGHKAGTVSYLSTDIETIRPTKSSIVYKGNPGYPYTISLAPSSTESISFSFWDYPHYQGLRVWKLLDECLATIPQIGQNYFNFDLHYLKALGFKRICMEKCQDTMLRHHMLWPELPHKLQFLCKQYTRQKYYKDEGKQWSPKNKEKLMRYNCLDTVVTFKVFEEQEKEFQDRLYLK